MKLDFFAGNTIQLPNGTKLLVQNPSAGLNNRTTVIPRTNIQPKPSVGKVQLHIVNVQL